jgi:retron-type reverse transcriptase
VNFVTFLTIGWLGDCSVMYQLGFQDPATATMEGIFLFNLHLLFVIIGIVLLVAWLLFIILRNFTELTNSNVANFTHSNLIEIIWTSIPALILLSLASPSFSLLYSLDEVWFYGANCVYSVRCTECDQNDVLRGAPGNTKKQVLKVNQSTRVRVSSHILDMGCKRFGVGARLFNGEAKGISSSSEVVSTVNSSGEAGDKKNGALKLDAHNLSEKNETQPKLSEVGLSDAIQKRSGSVIKKDVTKDGTFLNELSENASHEISDFNMIAAQKETERENILVGKIRDKWSDKKKKFVNLHEVIFDSHTLIYAYGDVIKSKGANTSGGVNINLNGINVEKIMALSDSLCNGSWRASTARRVLISKKRADKTRLLTLLSPYDKIIATAIQMVLNLIFEKHEKLNMLPEDRYFGKSSHGFRPNRGCHTALNIITTWGLGKWLIPGDISRCFDTIDQKRLISILGKSIEDQILIDTFYKFFNVQIKRIEGGGLDTSKGIGVPQGNPFSPLLANIYLNEFDQFLVVLKKEVDKGDVPPKNTREWQDATEVQAKELKKARSRKAKNKLKREVRRSKIKAARKAGIQQKLKTDEDLPDKIYRRVYYVRYADNYLIAIKGPKKLAKEVKKKTENFLKSSLHFELKGGDLIHGKDNKASFLGFDIKVPSRKDRAVVKTRKILSFKKIKDRISARKRAIEARFEKAIMKVYESHKLKTLKALMKGEKRENITENVAKYIASKDAKDLMKGVEMSGIKWLYDKEPFDT